MTGLLAAEFRRFFSRRSFRVIALLAAGGVLFAGTIVFFNSSHDPNSGLAQAQQVVSACKSRSAPVVVKDNPGEPFACPTVAELRAQFDKRFHYARTMADATRGVALPLFFLALIVSASFVGAEWGTGVMTTTLTWEPRRGRVLVAKIVPALVICAASVFVLLAFLAVAFLPIGAFRGTLHGVGASFWRHESGIWLRGSALAVFGAAMGIGLASFARNTVAAIGIGFGYFAIFDQIFSHLWKGRFQPWLFQQLSLRLMGLPVERPTGNGVLNGQQFVLVHASATRSLILLSIYGTALLLAAYAAFRTRDVT